MGAGWILGAVAVAVLAGLYLWYATLIRRANKAKEALASVDVHLRQRHDLIPNLVKLAGRFMEHERGLIEEVTRLRARAETAQSSGASGERFAAENALSQAAGRLLVNVEAYPALKSDATVIEAQRGWAETEAQITASPPLLQFRGRRPQQRHPDLPRRHPRQRRRRAGPAVLRDAARDPRGTQRGRPAAGTRRLTISAEALEQRRIWTLRGAVAGLLIPAIGWPLAMRFGEGSETAETIGGAVLLAGLIALIAVPVVLGLWRRHMARTLLDALVAGRSDLRHIDGATRQNEAATALGSPACELGQFGPAGLTEPFGSASIDHVLAGTSEGIPFVLAELRLYNEEGFEVFAGVVGGFQLQRACPGLTLVARDRGLLGNLIASAGTGIERVGVEDPNFERRFEAYGTDQVWSRTVLTTTMIERLTRLDDLAQARGFRCAFVGERLLLALPGLRWRAPLWRVVFPLTTWLAGYRDWLGQLIAMPSAVVRELALAARSPRSVSSRASPPLCPGRPPAPATRSCTASSRGSSPVSACPRSTSLPARCSAGSRSSSATISSSSGAWPAAAAGRLPG